MRPTADDSAPDRLRKAIGRFVTYCNSQRYHQAPHNVTPDDVWFGRREETPARRKAFEMRALIVRWGCCQRSGGSG